jgi:4-hydroxy-tetrahydrodipicolinate synthase
MPLHDALFCETSPGPLKYAASLIGICSQEARLPIVDIDDVSKQNVKKALQSTGLL